jgi:hypothetical protein
MTNVLDWILDLFRDPVQAQAFLNDPDKSMNTAGVQNVSAAQVNAVAATVAPAAVIHGGGNPVHGLQQAVAETHGLAFVPQTEAFSNNDTLSHNDTRFLSPETNVVNHAGEDQQQGVGNVDLDFGDITFGDKTTNTATDGGVVNTGNADDIDTTNVEGDGNVVGDDNDGNVTGDIETEDGSPVIIGDDNDVDNETQQAGGDIVQDNEGPVINDVDMSGGNGGGAVGGDGGGGLIGVGNDGGDATGGSGGSGGGIVINDDGIVDASDDDVAVQDNDVVTQVNDNDTTVNQGSVDLF